MDRALGNVIDIFRWIIMRYAAIFEQTATNIDFFSSEEPSKTLEPAPALKFAYSLLQYQQERKPSRETVPFMGQPIRKSQIWNFKYM